MTLYLTVPAVGEPVSLAELKAHARIAHDSEDALLSGLLKAARETLETTLGIAFLDQHWRLAIDSWPFCRAVALKRYPVQAVSSVTVYDGDGAARLVDPAEYAVDLHSRPAMLRLRGTGLAAAAPNGIEIDFVAGFGGTGVETPGTLKHAILMLAAHWYEFRAQFGAADQPVSWPAGFDRLVAPWKPGRL